MRHFAALVAFLLLAYYWAAPMERYLKGASLPFDGLLGSLAFTVDMLFAAYLAAAALSRSRASSSAQ